MKEYQAQVSAFSGYILGKITKSPKLFKRGEYILIAPQATKAKSGFVATIALNKESNFVNDLGTINAQILKDGQQSSGLYQGAEVCGSLVEQEAVDAQAHEEDSAEVNSGAKTANANALVLCDLATIEALNDGDVVQITPDGKLIVLLESSSYSNYLSLTERCNHRCIMCPQPPVNKENSRLAFNLRLIDFMPKSTQEIGITGGEPTLDEQELLTVLRALKKKMPDVAVTILTNAVKLSDINYASKIAACNIKDLQVDVPIFGATAEKHNEIVGAKTFYRTVKGIYNLAQCGVDVGLRIVVHKLTYQHLSDMAYFIYHNFPFVKQVAFMQMETIGYARDNIEQLWIDAFDYKDQLSEAINFLRLRRITALIYNAQLCVLNEDVWDVAKQSISQWKNINLEECQNCSKRSVCAGFFASHEDYHSSHIKALTDCESSESQCNDSQCRA